MDTSAYSGFVMWLLSIVIPTAHSVTEQKFKARAIEVKEMYHRALHHAST